MIFIQSLALLLYMLNNTNDVTVDYQSAASHVFLLDGSDEAVPPSHAKTLPIKPTPLPNQQNLEVEPKREFTLGTKSTMATVDSTMTAEEEYLFQLLLRQSRVAAQPWRLDVSDFENPDYQAWAEGVRRGCGLQVKQDSPPRCD